MGWYIGAKDNLDRALVQHYATIQTCTFDNERISAEEMMKTINLLSTQQKNFHFK